MDKNMYLPFVKLKSIGQVKPIFYNHCKKLELPQFMVGEHSRFKLSGTVKNLFSTFNQGDT